jgi:hypothetical protein
VLSGTSLGEVLPDTPYGSPAADGTLSNGRTLAAAGPSPKDATDR